MQDVADFKVLTRGAGSGDLRVTLRGPGTCVTVWEHGGVGRLWGTVGLATGGLWVGSHWGAHGVSLWVEGWIEMGDPWRGLGLGETNHGEVGAWVGVL